MLNESVRRTQPDNRLERRPCLRALVLQRRNALTLNLQCGAMRCSVMMVCDTTQCGMKCNKTASFGTASHALFPVTLIAFDDGGDN